MPKKARVLCHLRIGGSASSPFGALVKFLVAGCEPLNRIGVPYFVLSKPALLRCWLCVFAFQVMCVAMSMCSVSCSQCQRRVICDVSSRMRSVFLDTESDIHVLYVTFVVTSMPSV